MTDDPLGRYQSNLTFRNLLNSYDKKNMVKPRNDFEISSSVFRYLGLNYAPDIFDISMLFKDIIYLKDEVQL